MNKKGFAITTESIVMIGAVLLFVFLMIWVFRGGLDNFKNGIFCTGYEMSCQTTCEGDYPAEVRTAVLGCFGAGKRCCTTGEADSEEPGSGGTGGDNVAPEYGQAYVSMASSTGSIFESGRTITIVPEKAPLLTFTGSVQKDAGHNWKAQVLVQDSLGNELNDPFVDTSPARIETTINNNLNQRNPNFAIQLPRLTPKPQFMGERLKLTITVYPHGAGATDLQTSIAKYGQSAVKTYVMYVDVKPALRYAGLTTQWSQTKDIVAACEYVDCQNIYFKILDIPKEENVPGACDKALPSLTALSQLNKIETLKEAAQYCVYHNGVMQNVCEKTLNDCLDRLDEQEDADYSPAFNAIMGMLDEGLIDDAEFISAATQFSEAQSQASGSICLRTEPDRRPGTTGELYKAETFTPASRTGGRANFELDMPFMANNYLCVYGAEVDENNKLTWYSSGEPQLIRIDRNPPVASIRFEPFKLRLTFTCDDREGVDGAEESGCKEDAYWISYINQLENFVPALAGGKKQNAVAWCPPYQNTYGYSFTSKSRMQYNMNELRVMCLRVEDNAGNAGVAMATVYNGYDMLAGALRSYLQS